MAKALSKCTLAELRQLCDKKALVVDKKATKAELIKLLEGHKSDSAQQEVNVVEGEGVDAQNPDEDVENQDDEEVQIRSPASGNKSKSCSEESMLKLMLELETAKRLNLELQLKQQQSKSKTGDEHRSLDSIALKELKGILPLMTNDSDCVSYFSNLEKCLSINSVDKTLWYKVLPGCLAGNTRAQRAYSLVSLDKCTDYDFVKQTVESTFKLNSTAYYRMFQGASRTGQENYKLFNSRLRELFNFYTTSKSLDTLDKLIDDCCLNRFIDSLGPAAREFTLARCPKTSEEAANYADLWYEIEGNNRNAQRAARNNNGRVDNQSNDSAQQATGTTAAAGSASGAAGDNGWSSKRRGGGPRGNYDGYSNRGGRGRQNQNYGSNKGQTTTYFRNPMCFHCSGNHATHLCTVNNNNGNAGSQPAQNRPALVNDSNLVENYIFPVFVNGTKCRALRDTGSNQSFIESSLLNSDKNVNTGKFVTVRGLFGPQYKIPLYNVELQSPQWGSNGIVNATVGVVDGLHYQAIIGNHLFKSFPELCDTISVDRSQVEQNELQVVLPVITRQQAAKASVKGAAITQSTIADMSAAQPVNMHDKRITDSDSINAENRQAGQTTIVTRTSGDDNSPPASAVRTKALTAATDVQAGGNRAFQTRPLTGNKVATKAETDVEVILGDTATDLRSNPTVVTLETSNIRRSDSAERTDTSLNDRQRSDTEQTDRTLTYEPHTTTSVDRLMHAETTSAGENAAADDGINNEIGRLSSMVNNVLPTDRSNQLTEFMRAQREDPSLAHWFSLAERGSKTHVVENGVLFKLSNSWSGDAKKLLVLPACKRVEMLNIAHSSCFGGHGGRRKTIDRIENQGLCTFPKILEIVKRWIAGCHECQIRTPQKKSDRVPLKPIPRIPIPFSHVTFDTMGSCLAATPRGHKYILVHVDNASKYVDIVALKNLRADAIIAGLMGIWCRTGFPAKAVFDQSTSNMSNIFSELRNRLGIESCPSAVYLHHSSGQAEIAIKTVENMIKKFLPTCPRNWDKLLPILQMAINDSVNETVGLAPTEILYGHRLRGPLRILRETWINEDAFEPGQSKTVTEYLQDLHETLRNASDIAQRNSDSQQVRMKRIYDRQSTDRRLVAGQRVLLLMDSSPHKLENHWIGPVKVVKALNDFNYLIQLDNNRRQVFHINMLKPYVEPSDVVATVLTADSDNEDELPTTVELDAGDETRKEFTIGAQLTDAQRGQLMGVLNDFNDVLTERTGRTDLVEHVITLSENKVCAVPAYKIPDALKDQVEETLTKLIAGGFIRESQSSYSAPLIVIKKPNNNGIRLVNNFVKLNEITERDRYPMPDCAELLRKAAGAKYVSTLDLKDFYWQVPISEDSRKYTAFQTPWGSMEWCVMAQGLRGAPSTAQRLIDKLLRGASKYANSLQDDIIIHTTDFDGHLIALRDVLTRLRRAGLTANVRKCSLLRESMELFGHHLCRGEITPSDKKVEVIKNLTKIETKKKLMSFLGLCNYYSNHIDSYAEIAFPLTELLKKKVPNNIQPLWNEIHAAALNKLKDALISKPVLRAPDASRPFILQTDACQQAVAAALCQRDDLDREFVIGYASRKLLPREQNYSTIELEALAVKFGIEKFEQFIWGRKVLLQTDHKPLTFVKTMMNHNSRLARWGLFFQKWDLDTTWRQGCNHSNVDGLSRL